MLRFVLFPLFDYYYFLIKKLLLHFHYKLNSMIKGCGYKSVVRYDKFDSISLPLPEMKNPGLSLGHLLSEYVSSENLTDVTCESCNETCNHTKSVTFAKVKLFYDIRIIDFQSDIH